MKPFIQYETESRKIIIAPIEVEELKISVRNSYGRYEDSFKISFLNFSDAYDFLNLYELYDKNSKFIKFDLILYYGSLKFIFYGAFPSQIEQVVDKQIIEIVYDVQNSVTVTEEDELKIKEINRNLKLSSLGIE
jgi:hypothetical protein